MFLSISIKYWYNYIDNGWYIILVYYTVYTRVQVSDTDCRLNAWQNKLFLSV